ncbi:hypothetical protein FACS1894195_3670 [Bacteroidia bacterium]|nr:hypothetical protein FACS1894195_3670 [Bacteroidia bacterium]
MMIIFYYDITFQVEIKQITKKRKNQSEGVKEQRIVTSIEWQVNDNEIINEYSGIYFLRTSIQDTEKILWDSYNIIREIESTFRCLKTDLDLRPIYHKKDQSSLAHLHLGLLDYHVVSTIRYQLKLLPQNTEQSQEEYKLRHRPYPFPTKKFVVHRQVFEKIQLTELQRLYSG